MFHRSQGAAVCSLKQVPTSVQFAFVLFQEQIITIIIIIMI